VLVPRALYQPFPLPGAARGHVWRYQPQYRRPRHFHPEPELNLVTAGRATFGVGEAIVSVASGDLIRWLPGQDHELLEASTDLDLFVIGLTPALSARVLGADSALAYGGPARLRLSPEALARFRTLCVAQTGRQETSAIEQHVGDFWREAHAARGAASDMQAMTRRAVISLVEQPHLGRAEVALLARGCPSEVSRHFRRHMGLTLTAYRTQLRLSRFIQMADRAGNLLSAALAAGFGSYSQCHRAFQKTFGCTPRAFFRTGLRGDMKDAFSPWSDGECS
jgi:AraC-like DNA-binding protein